MHKKQYRFHKENDLKLFQAINSQKPHLRGNGQKNQAWETVANGP